MIDGIIRWSLANRGLVLIVSMILVVLGVREALRMPIDVFPDLTAPTVLVMIDAHGMAPREAEQLVSAPIEAALSGAPGVRRLRSRTTTGAVSIWVEFDWGADPYRARQIVSEKLQAIRSTLPAGVDAPALAPISSIMGEILFLALTSDSQSPDEVRATADWVVRRRLLAIPGVSQVMTIGGETRQYQVLLDPARLAAYGLGPRDVHEALSASSENVSAGFLVEGGRESLIHGFGRVRDVADIGETVVRTLGDEPVLVRHLGEVRVGHALKRGEGSYNAEPAVILAVQKQPDVNTLVLTRSLDEALDELARGLPPGTRLHRDLFRQADFIQLAVDNVTGALRDGALLVVLIVLLFLSSMTATGITTLAIPLSLLAAVLVLRAMGGTMNTMTLGGMAIAVGAIVDDAIIDVENVLRRLRERRALPEAEQAGVLEVVLEASREIRSSIVFATLIIALVFTPLFALDGVEGRLLRPLGVAYIVSLGASLLVALTLTPVLCSYALPRSRAVSSPREPWLVRVLKAGYRPLLALVIARWRLLSLGAALSLAAALVPLAQAGRAFLPELREGALTLSVSTLPGTSLSVSDGLGREVEERLLRHPEVVSVSRRTGRSVLDEHGLDVSSSEIDVTLRPGGRPHEELLAALREDLAQVTGLAIVFGQPLSHRIDHMLSGSRATVAIKLFGEDLHVLRVAAERARQAVATVPGIVDLVLEQRADMPQLSVRLDRSAISRHGLRIRDVTEPLEAALSGHVVNQVRHGERSFDLLVRVAPERVDELDEIRDLPITTPSGVFIPLRALADVRRDVGPNAIDREDGQRKAVVLCNVAGRDVVSVVRDIQARVTAPGVLPPNVRAAFGGQFERAEATARALLLLGALAVLGVLLLLIKALGSVRDALMVLLNLPLSLIGGVLGVFIGGGVLSVASLIGFIGLFGIATRNGLMLVGHVRQLQLEGPERPALEIVLQGALDRLSPILMTALASALALIPLALSGGMPGSEIETPMALVILFGLTTSTFLNMFLVPALYLRFGAAFRR